MIAIGCLLLIVLPIIGLTLGGLLAGPVGARWGAVIGFGVACVVTGLSGYAMVRIRRR